MSKDASPEWNRLRKLEFTEHGCPVCHSDVGKLLHMKTTAGYELHFHLCASCNALYLRNSLEDSCLKGLYGSKEFFAAGSPGGDNIDYFDFIGGEKYLRMTARERIRQIQKFRPSGKLLEVASAAGFFLIEAKNAGFETEGVEISAPMAKYASERWGVSVTAESIERLEIAPEHYDVIASWGVLTILRDPVSVFRKFHRALKPGGLWAFNTYYHDGLWHGLVGRRWNHLGVQISQIYSRQLLLDLCTREGFQLLSRRRDWPYTDLLKLADQLTVIIGWKGLVPTIQKLGLNDFIIRVPLPDVYEYVWKKV